MAGTPGPGPAEVRRFVAACRAAGAQGLVLCSSGNLSRRAGRDTMLVTASRAWLPRLAPSDVALCRISDGACLNGRRPSVETTFHAGVLRARPEVNVVLHFQTPFATTLACLRRLPRRFFVLPEIPYYIGPVAVVPCLPPGSPRLARAVVRALRRHDLAILRNHGQVTVGRDFDDAIQKAVFFELACRVILQAGPRLQTLPRQQAAALLRAKAV